MGEAIALLEEAGRLAEQARELHDAAAALLSKTWNEEQGLRQRALALEFDLKRLCSSFDSAALDPKIAGKIDKELYRARCLVSDGDVASLLPSKVHGRFLRMFLGPVNVRATRKEVQLKVKEEYNSYRDRSAFLFLLFPRTLLLSRSYIWDGCFPALPVQLYQAWLLFLYTSLALRENVLRVNGSDIRPWYVDMPSLLCHVDGSCKSDVGDKGATWLCQQAERGTIISGMGCDVC